MDASALVLAGSMAIAAGLVGAYALMRRMTLAADALSHAALPGIGVAILFRANPLVGAVVALLSGAIIVWALENRTRLATETIIGVVFSAALAVGALLTTGDELMEALFGGPTMSVLSRWELIGGIGGACCVIAFALLARNRLIVMLVSRDVARTAGIDVRRLGLVFMLAFALTVALGLRYLGVLLMGSLMIVPPATARYLARNLTQMLALSAAVAFVSTVAGALLAGELHRPTGPIIVAVATMCFFLAITVSRSAAT